MPRAHTRHVCTACGAVFPRWSGRCSTCGEWNTVVAAEPGEPRQGIGEKRTLSAREQFAERCSPNGGDPPADAGPTRLVDVPSGSGAPRPLGIPELDRVLSGGLVAGSVTLLGGEPGIGKSTLSLQAAVSLAERGGRSLVVTAEEASEQVRRRAERLGRLPEECFLYSTGDLLSSVEAADKLRPDLLVVDSIQAIADPSVSSPIGSVNQVRECAQLLARYARATGTATVLVGHVTKEGSLAGPRTLEHLVDTVLSFEGDRHHALRSLTSTKHRFGPAGELGIFEMTERGLVAVEDPSSLLLGDRRRGAAGSTVCPVIEGKRPLLVEVQALVNPARGQPCRRVVQGASSSRTAIVLALLDRFLEGKVAAADVFVSIVGGIKVVEPAGDLALFLAVASSMKGVALSEDTVVFGEIGLAGELRQVPKPGRRLEEAHRLGFERALVPAATPSGPKGMRIERIGSVEEAALLLGLGEECFARSVLPADPRHDRKALVETLASA